MLWTAANWEHCRAPGNIDVFGLDDPADPEVGFLMGRELVKNFGNYVFQRNPKSNVLGKTVWPKILKMHAVEFMQDVATVRGEFLK